MKPPPFVYHAPASLGEALEVLAGTGPDGKVLAGGQSLVPMLNMRLAAPGHVIDINRLAELDTIEATPAGVRVGALVRHATLENSAEAHRVQPLLRQALRLVAHPVVRNRGTTIGSIAHADPAAEVPAVLALLDGSVEVAAAAPEAGGNAGIRSRMVAACDFFTGPLESCLAPSELAVSAFFPGLPGSGRCGTAFVEVARRHGDYALAGVAALVTLDEDLRVHQARAAYIGVAPTPLVLDLTSAVQHRPANADWPDAAGYAKDHVEPESDIHASAEYRRHIVGVLTQRALREAIDDAFARWAPTGNGVV